MNRTTLAAIALALPTLVWADSPWDETTRQLGAIRQMPVGDLLLEELVAVIDVGRALFVANFTVNDGAGRPMASQAIIPTKTRRRARTAFARTSGPDSNGCASCHNEPRPGGAGGFVTMCSWRRASPIRNLTPEEFSNERGTNHLFGAGWSSFRARDDRRSTFHPR